MVEIRFKRKEANHTVNIAGKLINFKDGVAVVDEATAESLKEMDDPDYTVVGEAVKPKPKRRRKAKPKKEE